MKRFMQISAILVLLSLNSCATLISGTRQTIMFESVPAGATVSINGIDVGKTPCQVLVTKKIDPPVVTMKLKGYAARTFQMQSTFDPVAILNFFNPFAWLIDIATGALKKFDPQHYSIELEKIEEEKGK